MCSDKLCVGVTNSLDQYSCALTQDNREETKFESPTSVMYLLCLSNKLVILNLINVAKLHIWIVQLQEQVAHITLLEL